MFHFPAFPPHHLYIQWRVPRHDSWWVSPFGHPRITVRLSTPRGLTQTPTSFVGSSCQGIHRAPFKTYGNTKTLCAINCLQDARVHYAVLKKQPHTNTTYAFAPSSIREDQPHTPTTPSQRKAPSGLRAASQPNSVSPPQTHQPSPFQTRKPY